MKKTILFLSIALLPLAALAQHHAFSQGPGPEGPPDPFRAVAQYLELTPEQGEAWRGLLEDLRAQQQPLNEQVRALEEELRLLLQSQGPDPAVVGALVLEVHALRDQMRLNEEAYRAAFEDLLTETQKGKLYLLREAARLAPLFPAFRETRLL